MLLSFLVLSVYKIIMKLNVQEGRVEGREGEERGEGNEERGMRRGEERRWREA